MEEQKRIPEPQNDETPKSDLGDWVEEDCIEHKRKLEIICITDRMRICSTCALFGSHKGHDVRMEPDVVNELTARTELLIEMYKIVEDISANRID